MRIKNVNEVLTFKFEIMKKNIWILFILSIISVSSVCGQTTYYWMYYKGSGEGEFLGNLKAWSDYWGIQLCTGNKIRGMVNSDGKWCFLNPNETVYSSSYMNTLNQNINDCNNLALASDGNIAAKAFLLKEIGHSASSRLSIGYGRNGDAAIGCFDQKWIRIGGKGGIAMWGDDKYQSNDDPDFMLYNGSVTSKRPFHVNISGVNMGFLRGNDGNSGWIGTTTNHGLSLGTNNGSTFYIDTNRKVYIGLNKSTVSTIKPELKNKYELFVNAGILSADFAIAPIESWSDFVFDVGYELRNLEEVENFIDENKHLPDVPSANEVAENGYSQHEMNKVLLQKIEELTLYTIQQQKEITNLKAELTKLKND